MFTILLAMLFGDKKIIKVNGQSIFLISRFPIDLKNVSLTIDPPIPTPRNIGRKILAWASIIILIISLGISGYYNWQQYQVANTLEKTVSQADENYNILDSAYSDLQYDYNNLKEYNSDLESSYNQAGRDHQAIVDRIIGVQQELDHITVEYNQFLEKSTELYNDYSYENEYLYDFWEKFGQLLYEYR